MKVVFGKLCVTPSVCENQEKAAVFGETCIGFCSRLQNPMQVSPKTAAFSVPFPHLFAVLLADDNDVFAACKGFRGMLVG